MDGESKRREWAAHLTAAEREGMLRLACILVMSKTVICVGYGCGLELKDPRSLLASC